MQVRSEDDTLQECSNTAQDEATMKMYLSYPSPSLQSNKYTIKEAKTIFQLLQLYFERREDVSNSILSMLVNVENFVNSSSEAQMKHSLTDDWLYFADTYCQYCTVVNDKIVIEL